MNLAFAYYVSVYLLMSVFAILLSHDKGFDVIHHSLINYRSKLAEGKKQCKGVIYIMTAITWTMFSL